MNRALRKAQRALKHELTFSLSRCLSLSFAFAFHFIVADSIVVLKSVYRYVLTTSLARPICVPWPCSIVLVYLFGSEQSALGA